MAEAAVAAFGLVKAADRLPGYVDVFLDHELGYALAVRDGVGDIRQVYDNDADLTAIVGVDGAGSVDKRDPMAQRKSGTRTYLAFIALWQLTSMPADEGVSYAGSSWPDSLMILTLILSINKRLR